MTEQERNVLVDKMRSILDRIFKGSPRFTGNLTLEIAFFEGKIKSMHKNIRDKEAMDIV